VVTAGWVGGYGNLVEIRHLDDSLTRYAHNSRILVRAGEQVVLRWVALATALNRIIILRYVYPDVVQSIQLLIYRVASC